MFYRQMLSSLLCSALTLCPTLSFALPQGATVESGDVTFSTPDASTLHINQTSQHSLINWEDFSIGSAETTQFIQPNANAVSLNRVTGSQVSQILGTLQANGKVFLINPNGVVFGQGSQVNVGGLVATTSTLENADFTAGSFQFTATESAASIVNNGNITAAESGLVALVAPIVKNNGTITARLGTVDLHGAEAFTVDLYGDQLVSLAVQNGTLAQALAENSGEIHAAGGVVTMSAGQAADALNNVINMDGLIAADTLDTANGRIVLGTGVEQTTVNGSLSAQGDEAGETGGAIDVLGNVVILASLADLNASGQAGGGDIHIGGAFQGGSSLASAANTTVFEDVAIRADALDNGDGGDVVVWADDTTRFSGLITARGGENGGNGGTVEVSGKETLVFRGDVNTTAAQGETGTLLLDPQDILITDTISDADDVEVGDGDINVGDSGSADFTISAAALEALSGGTNIILEAARHITINNLADNKLALNATGIVAFKANSNLDGTGDFVMNGGDRITTNGASVNIEGANVTVGGIDTTGGSLGQITLTGNTVGLGGALRTNGGNLIINGLITLNNNIVYDAGSGSGNILFSSDMTGDYNFSINAGSSGALQLNNIDINMLAISNANTLTMYGDITTDMQQDYSNVNDIAIVRDVVLTVLDGSTPGNITFGTGSNIDGNNSLTLVGNDINLTHIGQTTPLDSLTINAAGTTNIASDIRTQNDMIFYGNTSTAGNLYTTANGDITLTGPVTLVSSVGMNTGVGAGDITLGSTVDGTYDLILAAGTGNIDITGAVGGSTVLDAVTISGNALTIRDGVRSVDTQTYTGAGSIGGIFSTSNQNISFSTGLNLLNNTTIDTASGGGDITFNGSIDGAHNLTINSGTGSTYFDSSVGSVTPLGNIDVTGNTVALSSMVSTGQQQYTGTLSLDGSLNVGSGSIDLIGDVTLLGHSGLNSGGAEDEGISISGSLTGDYRLDLTAGLGDILLRDINIKTLNLLSGDDLTLHGTILTKNSINFGTVDDIIIGSDTVLSAIDGSVAQDLIFDSENTITSSGANFTLLADDITLPSINGTGDLLITAQNLTISDGAVTNGTLTLNTSNNNLGGTFSTNNQDMTLNGATTLTNNLILSTGGDAGDILITNSMDGPYSLTATAGTGNFTDTGTIGRFDALSSVYIQANELRMKAITTLGAQDYIGTIMESGLLSGGQTVNMTGDVILGGGVRTSVGEVNIRGNVILTADSVLQTGGGINDILNIEGDILGDYNLEMRAGLADIHISGNMDINRWDITQGSDMTLGGGTFKTDEAMDFSNMGTITLSDNTSFIAKNESVSPNETADITMGPNNIITGPYNLQFEGKHVILYSIGDPNNPANTPLSLKVLADNFELLGTIVTVNEQYYTSLDGLANNLITTGANITLDTVVDLEDDVLISTGDTGGNIYFGGPVNGNHKLTINAGTGTVISDYNFGDDIALAGVDITASSLDLRTITTTGAQTYNGPATLLGNYTTTGGAITFRDSVAMTADTLFQTNGGDMTFGGSLSGEGYDATFVAGTGDLTFTDTVGQNGRLDVFTVESSGNLDLAAGLYVTDFMSSQINGTVNLGEGVGLQATRDISFYTPSAVSGYLAGRNVEIESTGFIHATVVAENLKMGGNGSFIQATLGGQSGRNAVHKIEFSDINGGPHFVNGYNVPLLGVVSAPQVLNMTAWAPQYNPLAVVQNTTAAAAASLNPASARADLIVANELALEGLEGESYALSLNPSLADADDDAQTFRLFTEVEL